MDLNIDTTPSEAAVSERMVDACIVRSAKVQGIPPVVLKAIRQQEGGMVGMANRNSDGSYDLGVMQLNTINLESIQRNFRSVTLEKLIFEPCINIYIASWFLKSKINEVGGDLWRGVGNYHSKTPSHHNRYLKQVKSRVRKLINENWNPQLKSAASRRNNRNVIGIHRVESE